MRKAKNKTLINAKGLSHTDAEGVFFDRQAYKGTSRAKKRLKKNISLKCFSHIWEPLFFQKGFPLKNTGFIFVFFVLFVLRCMRQPLQRASLILFSISSSAGQKSYSGISAGVIHLRSECSRSFGSPAAMVQLNSVRCTVISG